MDMMKKNELDEFFASGTEEEVLIKLQPAKKIAVVLDCFLIY